MYMIEFEMRDDIRRKNKIKEIQKNRQLKQYAKEIKNEIKKDEI